jgi:peptide/nickel transport system ATP-binding protein|tara:strand:+ start:6156 stop:7205 length:1050 start_codon:yes stop_codon:yes gene_type:complete
VIKEKSKPQYDLGGPAQPLLIVSELVKHFPLKAKGLFTKPDVVQAVDGLNFRVAKGETLGIVGESGCGKSTLAKLLMFLVEASSGEVVLDGLQVNSPQGISIKAMRSQVQMVFQDSNASLNPRMTIGDTIAFGCRVRGLDSQAAWKQAESMLEAVGLDSQLYARRYPHELSGGQRQRINIARALALEPRLLILDEAVSALDKSVEAQVLNLLEDLKQRMSLTYLFISHDLNVVQYISDRILVMYLGQIVEIGPVDKIYNNPQHPYTQALLSARPSMDPDNLTDTLPISGDPPNPINPPPGCRFCTRCPHAEPICSEKMPPLLDGNIGTQVACFMFKDGSGHSKAKRQVA